MNASPVEYLINFIIADTILHPHGFIIVLDLLIKVPVFLYIGRRPINVYLLHHDFLGLQLLSESPYNSVGSLVLSL